MVQREPSKLRSASSVDSRWNPHWIDRRCEPSDSNFFLIITLSVFQLIYRAPPPQEGGGAEGASSNIEFAIASVVNSVRLVASRRDISNLQWSARATRRADRWSGVFGGREICGCMKTSDYAVYKSLSGGKGEGGGGWESFLVPRHIR